MKKKCCFRMTKVFPKERIYALNCFKHDFIDLEFKNDGIHVVTCTDNVGNDFLIPYYLLDKHYN